MKYIVFILLSFMMHLNAQDIAVVKTLEGEVIAKKSGNVLTLKEGSLLDADMSIITKKDSLVTMIFKDGSILNLGANSLLNLEKFSFEPKNDVYDFKLFLKEGSMIFESGEIGTLSPEDFELKTPQGMIAIRGTKFAVKVEKTSLTF